jgi:hypothetical protein
MVERQRRGCLFPDADQDGEPTGSVLNGVFYFFLIPRSFILVCPNIALDRARVGMSFSAAVSTAWTTKSFKVNP